MKAILFLVTVFAYHWALPQTPAQTPTTLEEFNYAVYGYKETEEKGLDVKSGYRVQELGPVHDVGNYRYQFRALIREKTNEVAGVMVTAKVVSPKMTYFTCIPLNNGELLKRHYADLEKWPAVLVLPYAKVMSAGFAEFIARAYNDERK